MSNFQIFKELSLPLELQPNSLYLIASSTDATYLEVYVTGMDGSVIKRTPTKEDILSLAAGLYAENTGSVLEVVANITERDALIETHDSNLMVLVMDATGDDTVTTGAATYVYIAQTQTFTKIAAWDSLNAKLHWDSIQGKPNITQEMINTLLQNSHTHVNKELLDKLGTSEGGDLTIDGSVVSNVKFATPAW